MISCELDKKLSNFEKKDCFQTIAATQLIVNGRVTSSAFPALCYWSVDVILHNIRFSVQGTANQNTVS